MVIVEQEYPTLYRFLVILTWIENILLNFIQISWRKRSHFLHGIGQNMQNIAEDLSIQQSPNKFSPIL